jgi:3-dehydroquinate synthase
VGGKTAVDLEGGKNLAGAFWQPSLVLYDMGTMKTLPEDTVSDGMAEVIKYAMIADASLMELLLQDDAPAHMEEIVCRCVQIKADIVQADERDQAERMKLNFGHTFGHAVEALSSYRLSHGKAVAVGMAVITRAYVRMGRAAEDASLVLETALKKYGLPLAWDQEPEKVAEMAMADKKRMGQEVCLVVPERVGSCRLHRVQAADMVSWIQKGWEA